MERESLTFYLEGNTGSGSIYASKEDFLNAIEEMIDICILNNGTVFDACIISDVSVFSSNNTTNR